MPANEKSLLLTPGCCSNFVLDHSNIAVGPRQTTKPSFLFAGEG
jgi:hypothetical protein